MEQLESKVNRIREDLDSLTVNVKEIRQEVTDWRQEQRKNTDATVKLTESVDKLTDGVGRAYDDILATGRVAKMLRGIGVALFTVGVIGVGTALAYQKVTGESVVPEKESKTKPT